MEDLFFVDGRMEACIKAVIGPFDRVPNSRVDKMLTAAVVMPIVCDHSSCSGLHHL